MYQRVTSYVPTISIAFFAAILGLHSTQVFAASDCVRVLSHSAAQGRHRHYHADRGGRCWHTVAERAAIPSQVETASPPQQPDTARLPFASFLSSITSVFTTASTPKPDTLNPGAVAQPEPPPRSGNGARKRRRHAEAKRQRRHARAKRQQRHAEAKRQQRQAEVKPEPPPEAKAKPGAVSLDKANSDALFQNYFGRK
jgi:hypothetical protein